MIFITDTSKVPDGQCENHASSITFVSSPTIIEENKLLSALPTRIPSQRPSVVPRARRMSAQIVGNGNGVTSFPFNNTNENNQWPALSIIGVVVTVLGFIVVVWFIFLIFRREKALRGKAAAERDTLESSTGELQLARPVIQRQKGLIRLTQALVSKNRILYRCSTDTARESRRTGGVQRTWGSERYHLSKRRFQIETKDWNYCICNVSSHIRRECINSSEFVLEIGSLSALLTVPGSSRFQSTRKRTVRKRGSRPLDASSTKWCFFPIHSYNPTPAHFLQMKHLKPS